MIYYYYYYYYYYVLTELRKLYINIRKTNARLTYLVILQNLKCKTVRFKKMQKYGSPLHWEPRYIGLELFTNKTSSTAIENYRSRTFEYKQEKAADVAPGKC